MAANSKILLLDQLRASGLLQPAQVEELARLPEARNPEPRALARQVLQRGWLTRFQLTQAAQGRGKDLHVGPYVLLDRLGEGGMGQVFKAQHQHMGRVVALKVIRKEKLRNPEAVRRFYQEVQAAGQLHHPNIVLAYDAGQAGNTHFLSMEYVDGRDLAQAVKEGGPLPVAQAADYIRQAAVGLQHAHERGLVHRDIKPHNLLVTAANGPGGGIVKILDMGLARLNQTLTDQERAVTRTGAVIGTPDFLAPEQALDSRAADIRSDLYSLGCSLYFLLAGRAPFHAESLTQLLLKHQMEEPVPLESLRADVPPGVLAIVRALLAKRPEDRIQTPAELAAALEPFCSADGSAAPVPRAVAAPADAWAAITAGEEGRVSSGAGADAGDVTLVGAEDQAPVPDKGRRGAGPRSPAGNGALLLALVGAGVLVPVVALLAVGTAFWLWWQAQPSAPPVQQAHVHDTRKAPSNLPAGPPGPPPAVNPNPQQPRPQPAVVLAPREMQRLLSNPEGLRPQSPVLSPNGCRALGIINYDLLVWDVDRGQELVRSRDPARSAKMIAFLPDGRRALFATTDHRLCLWDVEMSEVLRDLVGHQAPITHLAVSAEGRRAVSAARPQSLDGSVRAWDLESGRELSHSTENPVGVRNLSISADGRRALIDCEQHIDLWDVDTGRVIRRLAEVNGRARSFTVAVLCPDGRHALVGLWNQGIRVWNVDTDREERAFDGQPGHPVAIAFTPDGCLAFAGHHLLENVNGRWQDKAITLRLWDVASGRQLGSYEGHTRLISSVSLSADGRRGLSASLDDTVRVWDLGDAATAVVRQPPSKPSPPVVKKAPVPEADEQAEIERTIRQQKDFKDDYARRPADRGPLVTKLLDKARETNDDPAGRYVLLREARDQAAGAGDAPRALEAVGQLARLYEVGDVPEIKLAVLTASAKAAAVATGNAGPLNRAVAESALAVLDELVAAEDYEKALCVVPLAETAARKAQQAAFYKRVEARLKEVKDARKDHEAARAARGVLSRQPNDPEACLTVGKYLCFRKGDWDQGLPLLARGKDQALQDLARADLARPAAAAEQRKVGDGWWDLAEASPELGKTLLQRRAAYWYQQALPGLTGLTQDRVEARLKEVLEQTPDLKPPGAVGEAAELAGHLRAVTALAGSKDGHRLLSGGADGTVRLWDVDRARQLRLFDGARGEIRSVALSPDGKVAAAGGAEGVWLWDTTTGQRLQVLDPGTEITGVVFSSDGRNLVNAGARGSMQVWKVEERRFSWSISNPGWGLIRVLAAVSGDRVYLFVPDDGAAHLYDMTDHKELGKPIRSTAAITAAACPPRGTEFAAVTDKVVQIWDLKTGLPGRVFKHPGRVNDVAYSADGRFLLTGCEDKAVRLWDVRSGRELRRLTGHAEAVTSVAFSGDGRLAFSGGQDKRVRVWQLTK
jgi:WD40 repeat protein/tRNA A-37 threonylcarbamoyl transferase component Bud32